MEALRITMEIRAEVAGEGLAVAMEVARCSTCPLAAVAEATAMEAMAGLRFL